MRSYVETLVVFVMGLYIGCRESLTSLSHATVAVPAATENNIRSSYLNNPMLKRTQYNHGITGINQ